MYRRTGLRAEGVGLVGLGVQGSMGFAAGNLRGEGCDARCRARDHPELQP